MPDIATQTENAPSDEGLSELEKVVWQAWKAMELPEGYHAEIIEGAIEVSPTGRFSHSQTVHLLREALGEFLRGGDFAARNDTNVVHGGSSWVPDLFITARDPERYVTDDGLGLSAAGVRLVVEVVSPGKRNQDRDRVRKRRECARAGIPVYVIIDDHDAQGTVTVLTEPRSDKGDWVGVHQVPYGTEVTIPEGPAKGFTLDEAITGPRRA
ncbi:Uma2 family endonuclease [Streptomyces sp. NBC_01361]|uniref:Uma2 family endonuclease n=1 Tax=Streptomyces sp. NBC_01361 TaxID=2903838 RepID=UPI002E3811AB|nr:Uma2 family endonuclease [Streptomyces sp. NBC_01361]